MADEKASKWQYYIIPDLATWTGAAGNKPHTPIEFYDNYEQAAARFQELRSKSYNSEDLSAARLTFGVQRDDPPSAADLLQVRQGKNYLVDDYTRMDAVNQSPEVMGILKQMRKDLGFDRVRVYERDAYGGSTGPKDMAFSPVSLHLPLKFIGRKRGAGSKRKEAPLCPQKPSCIRSLRPIPPAV